jgi:hypothetical protein
MHLHFSSCLYNTSLHIRTPRTQCTDKEQGDGPPNRRQRQKHGRLPRCLPNSPQTASPGANRGTHGALENPIVPLIEDNLQWKLTSSPAASQIKRTSHETFTQIPYPACSHPAFQPRSHTIENRNKPRTAGGDAWLYRNNLKPPHRIKIQRKIKWNKPARGRRRPRPQLTQVAATAARRPRPNSSSAATK